MPKIDRVDRLIRDYINGNIDKRIQARIEQLTYKSKIDNLGIRTAYSRGSEEEKALLLKESIDEDSLILQLKHEKYQVECWIIGYDDARKICELRWKKGMQQWEIGENVRLSKSTIYRRYDELKQTIIKWSGFNADNVT